MTCCFMLLGINASLSQTLARALDQTLVWAAGEDCFQTKQQFVGAFGFDFGSEQETFVRPSPRYVIRPGRKGRERKLKSWSVQYFVLACLNVKSVLTSVLNFLTGVYRQTCLNFRSIFTFLLL